MLKMHAVPAQSLKLLGIFALFQLPLVGVADQPEKSQTLTPNTQAIELYPETVTSSVRDTPWGKLSFCRFLKPVSSVAPAYPPELRTAGKQGEVTVVALVDTSGVPIDIKILISSGYGGFDDSAVSSFRQWRFPIMHEEELNKGAPCRGVVVQTIVFNLNNQDYLPKRLAMDPRFQMQIWSALDQLSQSVDSNKRSPGK
jgi:TonB family protein